MTASIATRCKALSRRFAYALRSGVVQAQLRNADLPGHPHVSGPSPDLQHRPVIEENAIRAVRAASPQRGGLSCAKAADLPERLTGSVPVSGPRIRAGARPGHASAPLFGADLVALADRAAARVALQSVTPTPPQAPRCAGLPCCWQAKA